LVKKIKACGGRDLSIHSTNVRCTSVGPLKDVEILKIRWSLPFELLTTTSCAEFTAIAVCGECDEILKGGNGAIQPGQSRLTSQRRWHLGKTLKNMLSFYKLGKTGAGWRGRKMRGSGVMPTVT
jgi:hypothetical protein